MALVTTIYGDMDDSQLEKRTTTDTTPQGTSIGTEYWLNNELVHRSVHFVFAQDAQPVSQ